MAEETIQPAPQEDASASGGTPEVDTQKPVGGEPVETPSAAPEGDTSPKETAVEKKAWYQEIYGDKYKDEQSALDGTKELNTKIGQGNEEAKSFNNLADAVSRQYGMSNEEAKNYLKDPTNYVPKAQENTQVTPATDTERLAQMEKTQAIMMENQQLDKFFTATPEAKKFEEQLKALGRVNINESYKSIYERTIEPAFKAGKEASYKKLEDKQDATPQSGKGSVPQPDTSKQDLYNAAKKSSDSGQPDMDKWGSILMEKLK